MPRPIWKGSLNFGLVDIPVSMFPATSDKTIHFHQIEDGTSDRIRYKKVNEKTGKEVPLERITKAMDVGGGEYVVVSDKDLADADPDKSRIIDVEGFVDLGEIDPIYFRTTYYLAPQSEAGAKAYQLLRDAMKEDRQIGIASFVMRNKEYLVAIRPEASVLALETLYFSDEIRDPTADLPYVSDHATITPKERAMAQSLIESLSEKWDPAHYHDSYREHVQALLKEKQAGHESIRHIEPARGGKVIDLLEALQASVKEQGRTPAAVAKRSAAKSSSSKGSTVKKPCAKRATTTKKKAASKTRRAS